MIVTNKLEIAIKLFCILILIGLNLAIYFNGKDLDCNECKINFESFRTMGVSTSMQIYQNFSVKITDLHGNLTENHCLVLFDEENGYYYNKVIK